MSGKVTCPQAVSRESHRTRNKNKQTNILCGQCGDAARTACRRSVRRSFIQDSQNLTNHAISKTWSRGMKLSKEISALAVVQSLVTSEWHQKEPNRSVIMPRDQPLVARPTLNSIHDSGIVWHAARAIRCSV
jgi:hypothetical protein